MNFFFFILILTGAKDKNYQDLIQGLLFIFSKAQITRLPIPIVHIAYYYPSFQNPGILLTFA
jgi:hypothetical protein